jgi:hypothetical protein
LDLGLEVAASRLAHSSFGRSQDAISDIIDNLLRAEGRHTRVKAHWRVKAISG